VKHRIKLRRPNRTYGVPDNYLVGLMVFQYVLWLVVTLPFMPFTYEGFWWQLVVVLLSGLAGPLLTYALFGHKYRR
jgi:hypothetical protein